MAPPPFQLSSQHALVLLVILKLLEMFWNIISIRLKLTLTVLFLNLFILINLLFVNKAKVKVELDNLGLKSLILI